jgi:hypothetical protein
MDAEILTKSGVTQELSPGADVARQCVARSIRRQVRDDENSPVTKVVGAMSRASRDVRHSTGRMDAHHTCSPDTSVVARMVRINLVTPFGSFLAFLLAQQSIPHHIQLVLMGITAAVSAMTARVEVRADQPGLSRTRPA